MRDIYDEMNPTAEAFLLSGSCKVAFEENREGAIADYTEAINIYPEYAKAYYSRGQSRFTIGDQQGGVADIREASRLFKLQKNETQYQRCLGLIETLESLMST